jgi:hypothetical protein
VVVSWRVEVAQLERPLFCAIGAHYAAKRPVRETGCADQTSITTVRGCLCYL